MKPARGIIIGIVVGALMWAAIFCAVKAAIAAPEASRQARDTVTIAVPRCEEDEGFYKGKGDYDGEKWTRYVCIHQDDITRVPRVATVLVGKDRIRGTIERDAYERLIVLVTG